MIQIAEKPPKFAVGQLVRHRRYRYRGVIVSVDRHCQAEESWYQSNRTQPARSQPWYHVLVDGTRTATYAAEENLAADDRDEPIDHPLVRHFFSEFADGAYVRNEVPWEGW